VTADSDYVGGVDPVADDSAVVPDGLVVAVAAVLVGSVVAVGSASSGTRIAAGVTVAAVLVGVLRYPFAQMRGRRTGPVIVLISVGLIGSALSLRAEAGLAAGLIGPFTGPARVVDDPRSYRSATWVIIDIDGSRHEIWARSNSDRRRVASLRAGEWVVVSGEREPLDPDRARRVAWQHVIGSFRVDWLGDVTSGGPLARASNRVRSLVADGAALIGEPDDSLLRGLVIGDDLDQPPEMIERFRRSGLSHLTAVSGQNVTLVLAAGAPLLRRLGSRTRLVTTVALIAWFVAITRFEPSILRAGTMAVLATVGTHLGRERTPMRMLALALSLLVVIDPLITRSVGLWLSVGATAGVVGLGPRLAEGLGRFGVLATPVGITLGAQLGVALPSVLTFGRLPLVGLVANLLAVPVAGAVMLLGLPACLIAGALGGISPDLGWLALAPVALGVRWVDQISIIGDRIEPESSVYGIVVTLAVGVAALYRFEWRRRRGVPEMAGVL